MNPPYGPPQWPYQQGGYGPHGYQQPPPQQQQNLENHIPDYSNEHALVRRELTRIDELYGRLMRYLDTWEYGEGLGTKNPHLFIQTVVGALTQLHNTVTNNTRLSADLKTKLSDIKMKAARDEDENEAIREIASEYLREFAEQRYQSAKSNGGLPTIYSGAPVQDDGRYDKQQMVQSWSSNDHKTVSQAVDRAEQQVETALHRHSPARYAVRANGEFVVVDPENKVLEGYPPPPATKIVKWVVANNVKYGIGDDNCRYEVV